MWSAFLLFALNFLFYIYGVGLRLIRVKQSVQGENMKSLTDPYILRNGVGIPCIGFGTWDAPDGEIAVDSVKKALKAGYRHIDTAAIYGNEDSVGKAVRESGIPRSEIFVTTKLWNTERGYKKTLAAFEKSMKKLGLDYLDLYLIHWPANAKQFKDKAEELNNETWQAFEDLYKAGNIKAIGVSNFFVHHLEALLKNAEIPPMVNQIEYHPGFKQDETAVFCKANNIIVQAWSPLGRGKVLSDKTIAAIAAKYKKSPAQICIRWILQKGLLPLPKSVTESRIIENGDVFDFVISAEDIKAIDSLPTFGDSGFNPDEVDF